MLSNAYSLFILFEKRKIGRRKQPQIKKRRNWRWQSTHHRSPLTPKPLCKSSLFPSLFRKSVPLFFKRQEVDTSDESRLYRCFLPPATGTSYTAELRTIEPSVQ